MLSSILSACPNGVQALPITVEADVYQSKLHISIVGLPDAATREAKDRLIPAIKNSGIRIAGMTVTINLSPADLRKEGASFDLPMAIGILTAKGDVPYEKTKDALFMGELALDGSLRPVRSVLAGAECAKNAGLSTVFVPMSNGWEAALVPGLTVYEVSSLSTLIKFLKGQIKLFPFNTNPLSEIQKRTHHKYDFSQVKGQTVAKRVLEIAAAGGHNVLLVGPPGSGKSMLSKRLPTILPQMSTDEIIETTRIYSVVGKLADDHGPVMQRPFRAPHHTASPAAMIGGGSFPRPGEVTLAHRGVLFLDEFPEFPRTVLEVLRQPLEDLDVTISRTARQVTFPADFILVAAMNPCPCGYLGAQHKPCRCSENRIQQYRSKISGPLLDRIDLHVECPVISPSVIRRIPTSESSEIIRNRVIKAREIQRQRFQSTIKTNARMEPEEITQYCVLSDEMADLLERKMIQFGYSTRVYCKIQKLARTIADLAGRLEIIADDLMEALSYRRMDLQEVRSC